MTLSFSLIEHPWIPVRWLDGHRSELGLRDMLQQAPAIREIEADNPVQQISLLRLLLAVLQRAAPLEDIDAAAMRLRGGWPTDVISDYLTTWMHRFDLYSGDQPFLQVPWLAAHEKSRGRIFGLVKINSDWSSGNEKTLLDHHHSGAPPSVSAARVARMLVAHQQFVTGGLSKIFKDSAPGGPCLGFAQIWVAGNSLSETLTLNQLPADPAQHLSDLPAWETSIPQPGDLANPLPPFAGPASRFAHLSRCVLLLPDTDGSCARLHWAEGLSRVADPHALDPMEAQLPNRDGTWRPLRLDEQRAFWRDYHALLVRADGRAPPVVANAVAVLRELGAARMMRLSVGGLLADKAKLVLWRQEEQPVPAAVLGDPVHHATVVKALELGEEAGRLLNSALRNLAAHRLRERGEATKADISNVVGSLPGNRNYWKSLEAAFWRFLADVTGETELALSDWRLAIGQALDESWRLSVHALGANARVALAAAQAESLLRKARSAAQA